MAPFRGLLPFFSGTLSRRALVAFIFPAAFVSYFGSLALAICLVPGSHNWRSTTISRLALYPQDNPEYYWIASTGIALAGGFIIPFAGYLGRQLRWVTPAGSRIGAGIFRIGAAGSVVTGLIAYHGNSRFPMLHTLLARGSAFALGAAMIVFWVCALRGRFRSAAGRRRYGTVLIVVWSILVLSGASAAVVSTLEAANRFHGFTGLFEWAASAIIFLFLLSSALLLPE